MSRRAPALSASLRAEAGPIGSRWCERCCCPPTNWATSHCTRPRPPARCSRLVTRFAVSMSPSTCSTQTMSTGPTGWRSSVPMHTAMRLALRVAETIRARRPELPLCFYGLYAPVSRDLTVRSAVDAVIAGEYETGLVAWVDGEDPGPPIQLARVKARVPARHLLPPLDRYTRLAVDGEERLVGSVEASRGCSHRCRHCPVPGRIRRPRAPGGRGCRHGRYRPAGGGRCPPCVLRRPGLPQRPAPRTPGRRGHARASSGPDLRLHDQGGAHPAPPRRSP